MGCGIVGCWKQEEENVVSNEIASSCILIGYCVEYARSIYLWQTDIHPPPKSTMMHMIYTRSFCLFDFHNELMMMMMKIMPDDDDVVDA